MPTHHQGAGKTGVNVVIPEAIKEELEKLAEESGMSLNSYCGTILAEAAASLVKIEKEERNKIVTHARATPPRMLIIRYKQGAELASSTRARGPELLEEMQPKPPGDAPPRK